MIVLAPPPSQTPAVSAAARQPGGPPTEVAPVVVTAFPRDPPVLASSWPAQGAAIAPGTMVVKLVFSQPMQPGRWGYGPAAEGGRYPRCLDRPRLLADQRTVVLLCVTAGKGSWTLRLNPPGAPEGEGGGFVSAGGRPLAPVELSFTTTDDRSVASLDDAMKAASLADDQGPVMGERAQAAPAAASQAPSKAGASAPAAAPTSPGG